MALWLQQGHACVLSGQAAGFPGMGCDFAGRLRGHEFQQEREEPLRTDAPFVAQRLGEIQRRAQLARESSALAPGAPLRIVAVTKYLMAEEMGALRAAGLEIFGESRVQDALPKVEALQGAAAPREWHFIGTLQGNKVRAVAGRFHLIHSVDRLEVAQRLSDAALEAETRQAVLVQVNISCEASKHGFPPEVLLEAWPRLMALPGLWVRGLMGMAAAGANARPSFRALRELRDRLDGGRGELPELSMGMSGDFEDAVAEGATLVRIGTSLFSEEVET